MTSASTEDTDSRIHKSPLGLDPGVPQPPALEAWREGRRRRVWLEVPLVLATDIRPSGVTKQIRTDSNFECRRDWRANLFCIQSCFTCFMNLILSTSLANVCVFFSSLLISLKFRIRNWGVCSRPGNEPRQDSVPGITYFPIPNAAFEGN